MAAVIKLSDLFEDAAATARRIKADAKRLRNLAQHAKASTVATLETVADRIQSVEREWGRRE